MKQKLIALLKTLFASKGFNAKELEGLADIAIKQQNLTDDSTDEDLTAASEAIKPLADFTQSVASRQVTDVKKPKPVDPKPDDTPAPDDVPNPNETATEKMLRQLLEGQKAQAAELAALKGEKVTNTRKATVESKLANVDDKFKAATLKAFGRMKFETQEEFDEYLTELETDAKDFVKVEGSEDGISDVFRPAGGVGTPKGGKEASAAEVDAAVEAII